MGGLGSSRGFRHVVGGVATTFAILRADWSIVARMLGQWDSGRCARRVVGSMGVAAATARPGRARCPIRETWVAGARCPGAEPAHQAAWRRGEDYWKWASRPAPDVGLRPGVGLRTWREHCVFRPDGPRRSFCARYGRCAKVASTLERYPGETTARLPSQVESAIRAGCFTRATPSWVRVRLASAGGSGSRIGARPHTHFLTACAAPCEGKSGTWGGGAPNVMMFFV